MIGMRQSLVSHGRGRCISTPFHQVLDLSVSHPPLGSNSKRFPSIDAVHGAAKVLVHRLFKVQHGMSTASNSTAAAGGGRGAGRVPATLARRRLLWSLAQQSSVRRFAYRWRWRLQVFGIYGKVVAGNGIYGCGADNLVSKRTILVRMSTGLS